MKKMFSYCKSFEKLDLSSFYCNSKSVVKDKFKDYSNLKEIKCNNEIIINKYNGDNLHPIKYSIFYNNLFNANLLEYGNLLLGCNWIYLNIYRF